MSRRNDDRLLTTVVNVFEILGALQEHNGATVSELAASFEMSRSTLYDYLGTLYELEYVVKDGDEYDVGLKCLDHGMYAREKVELLEHASGPLQQLAIETGQVAWLYVEEHGRLVYLDSAEGERAVRTRGRVGMRSYLHCTAAGKAMLAHLPEEAVRDRLPELPKLTAETITDVDALLAECEAIRDRGYAFNVGESMPDARAVAAPILIDDEPLGAVTVVGAANRLRGTRFREDIPEVVLAAANDIELNFRYR